MSSPKRVLILCTGNSCRSQMAEALWEMEGGGEWRADSAGTHPAGYVHPMAIRVMAELERDLSGFRSKSTDEFADEAIDLVVTVCDSAQENCPAFPGAGQTLHWPFPDPADAEGTEDEICQAFREIRDRIRQRIRDYLSPD